MQNARTTIILRYAFCIVHFAFRRALGSQLLQRLLTEREPIRLLGTTLVDNFTSHPSIASTCLSTEPVERRGVGTKPD
jgi:hypothetical protein